MTTGQLIIVDHVVALLSVAAWFAAGATAAVRRERIALGLLASAVLVTLARVSTVAMLAGRGWWFVQEKVLLGLPLLGAAGLAAALIAGPRLRAAGHTRETGTIPSRAPTDAIPVGAIPADGIPAGSVVALFTAGYAALAGLVVTLLTGYPLAWSTALIATSLVGAGALLTARIVVTPAGTTGDAATAPSQEPRGKPGLPRRRLISVAGRAVVAGTGTAGLGLAFIPAETVPTGAGPGRSSRSRPGASSGSQPAVSVADLRGADAPAPGGTRRQYTLTARTATVRLPSGREIQAWTYNGEVPGPAITATQGDLLDVRLRNADIEDGVTLHWHGYDVPCGEDGAPGVTQMVVEPGEDFVYRFRADQVGTYWYHTHQASDRGVRRGLYGTLVVTPRGQQVDRAGAPTRQLDLTLPVHTFDGVVVIADGRTAHTAPAGTAVRLRLINTDSDPHRLALAGTPFRVTAVDGRDLNRPGEIADAGLRLPAGGRFDLVFLMPGTPVALIIDNDHTNRLRLRSDDNAGGPGADPAVADTSGWPELDLLRYGAPSAVPFDAGSRADRRFTMVLDRGLAMVDGRPAYARTVNGRGHPSVPDQLVAEGDLVRFTVVNRGLETHPWHLHGHPVLILSRDGTPSTGSPLWMDTFDVRPGQVWEVAFRATNRGIWMNHCHNLPHAHQGMMLRLRYEGITTPFGGSHGGSRGHVH